MFEDHIKYGYDADLICFIDNVLISYLQVIPPIPYSRTFVDAASMAWAREHGKRLYDI